MNVPHRDLDHRRLRRRARLVSVLFVPLLVVTLALWLLFKTVACTGGYAAPWELLACDYTHVAPDLGLLLVLLSLGWFLFTLSRFGRALPGDAPPAAGWRALAPVRHARRAYRDFHGHPRRIARVAVEASAWGLALSLAVAAFAEFTIAPPLGVLVVAALGRMTFAVGHLLAPRRVSRAFEAPAWAPPPAVFPPGAAQRAGKNIVICADGTGNTAIKGRGTNVFKLYEAVDETGLQAGSGSVPQAALYHDGVGTESLKWVRFLTGATGWGLSRNVRQLYGELARVYAPGDKIFLFGFSRGAFTVRTLAGLIHACGVLDLTKASTNADFDRLAGQAYKEYRKQYNSRLTALFHRTTRLDEHRRAELRARFSVEVPEFAPGGDGKLIAFLGVWDTVDAVGLPIKAADFVNRWIYAFKFPDRTLSSSVGHACHALALDEERESFAPVLWDESKTEQPERIEQVWFAGVHSNVGGGYPRQGMSLVALNWMMARAEAHGLRFLAAERQAYRDHADVDDKMYDSRAGVGVFYRWQPRDAAALCAANAVTPKVHVSVFGRIARNTEGYAPGSLPPDPVVVSLSQPSGVTDEVRRLVRDHHAGGPPLLEREAELQRAGIWSYWLFVWGVFVVAALVLRDVIGFDVPSLATVLDVGRWVRAISAAAGQAWEGLIHLPARACETLATLFSPAFVSRLPRLATATGTDWLGRLIAVDWIQRSLRVLGRHPGLVFWLVVMLGLGLRVDGQLDRSYSEFWQSNHLRLRLRKALGLG